MTKTRNIILTILVSAFISGLISYLNEFNQINKAIPSIEYTIQTAVDMGIQQSIMSDDFYLEGFNYGRMSGINIGSEEVTNTELWVYGTAENKNMLDAIMKYSEDGYDSMKDARKTSDIQNTAINGGDIFKKNAFNWQFDKPEFESFYTWIRDTGRFKTPIYYRSVDSDGDYIYEEGYVCTLDLMGLADPIEYPHVEPVRLYDTKDIGDSYRNATIINSVDINEEVTTVLKEGYYGTYMLTPTTLGITYITKDMLIPIVKSNLEMMCAYNFVNEDSEISQLGDKHRGCLNNLAFYNLTHKEDANEYIVNNGLFEIDLNSVDVNIEYKALDMFDSNNNEILDLALGAKPLGTDSHDSLVYTGDRAAFLKSQYNISESSKYIVVAKIDVTVKLHVPFRSPLLQLYRSFEGGDSNHLDIKVVDTTGSFDNNVDSGILYTYTTYTAVTP